MGHAAASVEIDAPLDVVWRVMLDVSAYGEWNPFVYEVEGTPGLGSILTLHVRFASGRTVTTREEITRLEPPSLLEYAVRGPLDRFNLVRGRRQQRLRDVGDGRTVYETDETLTGFLAFAAPLKGVQDGFERHAAALKARAEYLR